MKAKRPAIAVLLSLPKPFPPGNEPFPPFT